MLRGRFNYPDLDVLDSPLVSPTPFTSFSGMPGSALAEKIFNDPDSWEDNDADDSDLPDEMNGNEQLAWLAEEIEKFRAGVDPNGAFELPSTPTDKVVKLITTPTSAVPQNIRASIVRRDAGAGWKGIAKKGNVRPISLAALFEHSNEDFSDEIQQQLSKILESGGIPHHVRPYPHSSALSPPSTSGTSSTLDSPLQLQTASTVASSSGESSPSPINVYSASATLTFLEWYGIYPDSPKLDINGLGPKSARLKTPLVNLQVPSPRHAVRPSSLLSPTSTAENFTLPPAKRASSVPPPGLDAPTSDTSGEMRPPSPPGLSRSPSPFRGSDQDQQQSNPAQPAATASERGRALHTTAPPPYSRTASSPPPVSRSNSSTSSHPSRAPTPARGVSQDQPIRRLPSIPPESSTSRPSTPPQPLPQPPVQVQPQTQSRASPPPPPQRVPSRQASPGPTAQGTQACSARQQQQGQQPGPRPMSIRSPLGGPAGPRTRSRASHDVGHRPPVLRL